MSSRSRAGLVASVGFAILGLLAPVMYVAFRLILSGDIADAGVSDTLTILSRTSTGVSFLAWFLVLGGLFTIYRRRPTPMLQTTLGLWSASLAAFAAAFVLIPYTPVESDLSQHLASLSTALQAFGIATALLYHHKNQAPRERVLVLAVLAALNYALYLLPYKGGNSGSQDLLGILATATHTVLYLGLAVLPWSKGVEETATAPQDTSSEARRHFIAGGIAIAVGLLLTFGSYAIGGIDGRALLAWGPVVYGVIRVFQGLTTGGRS